MSHPLRWCILPLLFLGCATATTTRGGINNPAPHVYSASPKALYSEALIVLSGLAWQVTHSDASAGVIIAQTPKSITTYGDVVTVRIVPLNDGGSRVEVTSSTKQAFDWGKGRRNITKVYNGLAQALAAPE